MVDIYYDPHEHTVRDVAHLCAVLLELGARSEDREQARAILDTLTEGSALSVAERQALTRLRATYGGDPASQGGPAAATGPAIEPQANAAQRWEDEGGAVRPHDPAGDPPVEA